MKAYEDNTLLLTLFITLLNSFLMSLWSQFQVFIVFNTAQCSFCKLWSRLE